MLVNLGEQSFEKQEEKKTNKAVKFVFRPKGVGFGGGAGTLGMDTGEHLGNKSGSEMT